MRNSAGNANPTYGGPKKCHQVHPCAMHVRPNVACSTKQTGSATQKYEDGRMANIDKILCNLIYVQVEKEL